MRQAVPSLDLVLTPNGFGIVSNSNIAPASKERVERLITSLESERDNYIEQLLPLLVQNSEWRDTEQYRFFASTLFPNITLATLCGYHKERWKHYLGLKHRASFIEQQLSEEYISTAQMNTLRNIYISWVRLLQCRVSSSVPCVISWSIGLQVATRITAPHCLIL